MWDIPHQFPSMFSHKCPSQFRGRRRSLCLGTDNIIHPFHTCDLCRTRRQLDVNISFGGIKKKSVS